MKVKSGRLFKWTLDRSFRLSHIHHFNATLTFGERLLYQPQA